jgi:Holliday junction resolvase RusA-like endonuclease
MIDQNSHELRAWQATIHEATRDAMAAVGWITLDCPVTVTMDFTLPAPKPIQRLITQDPTQPRPQAKWPDVDKLIRAVADALSGRAYLDDKLISRVTASKRYPGSAGALDRPGVLIQVREWKP